MPTDRYGLPLTCTGPAADAFGIGVDRTLAMRAGADEAFAGAAGLDPGFALAHAARGLLAVQSGDRSTAAAHLRTAAERAEGASDREIDAVRCLVETCTGDRSTAYRLLTAHLETWPADALILVVTFPTIAFCGVTEVTAELWPLVEQVAPVYGDDWFYTSLLAFVRQDQGRFAEAEELAAGALAAEPRSGHGMHAATHVFYETGRHDDGLAWLDRWLAGSGSDRTVLGHGHWHAALHELRMGNAAAAQRRWWSWLVPPHTCGARALVDAGSMLFRSAVLGAWTGDLPADRVLDAAPADLVFSPASPFLGLNAALTLGAAGDADGLARLRAYADRQGGAWSAGLVPVLDGLLAQHRQRFTDAADAFGRALPELTRVGGSLAQREVILDAFVMCLAAAGRVTARQLDQAERRGRKALAAAGSPAVT
jgi:tetratricopeptide (TPR) repeat protein